MYTLSAVTVFPDIDRFAIFFGPQMRSKINNPMQGLKPKKLDCMTFVGKEWSKDTLMRRIQRIVLE